MTPALAEKLEAVRGTFLHALPGRLDEVAALVETVARQDPAQDAAMHRIHRILHELSGSAGLLGAKDVGVALAPAFEIAENAARHGHAPNPQEIAILATSVDQARRVDGADVGPASPAGPP